MGIAEAGWRGEVCVYVCGGGSRGDRYRGDGGEPLVHPTHPCECSTGGRGVGGGAFLRRYICGMAASQPVVVEVELVRAAEGSS